MTARTRAPGGPDLPADEPAADGTVRADAPPADAGDGQDVDDGGEAGADVGDGDGDGDAVAELRRYRVEGDDRPRLDAFVAGRDPTLSRAAVQRLIDDGEVTVNDLPATKAGARLRPGDRVEVSIPAPVPIDLEPEPMDLAILFEDAHLVVLDKPAGLVVHPAPGHPRGTLVHGLLAHIRDLAGIGGELRPGIVHRLDKDTSGVMVVAKDEATLLALQRAFKAKGEASPDPARSLGLVREYLAVCAPAPRTEAGTLRTLHDRHPVDRKRFSTKVARGKPAVTHWQVIERFAVDAALVRCRLETGRTHQIRVHFADAGWPLVGDPLYGRRYTGALAALAPLAAALGRQALHAARLALVHPISGAPLDLATAPPADLAALLAALRGIITPRR